MVHLRSALLIVNSCTGSGGPGRQVVLGFLLQLGVPGFTRRAKSVEFEIPGFTIVGHPKSVELGGWIVALTRLAV